MTQPTPDPAVPFVQVDAVRGRLRLERGVLLPTAVVASIARGERQRPANGRHVKSVTLAAEMLGVEPRFYGCPECTINHAPAECPKVALDKEIAAGMPADDPADQLANAERAEAIRMAAMQAVIAALDDLGDGTPPWLAPVIAANVAVVSVCDQVLDLYENRRTEALRDLAEHVRPLTRTGWGVKS